MPIEQKNPWHLRLWDQFTRKDTGKDCLGRDGLTMRARVMMVLVAYMVHRLLDQWPLLSHQMVVWAVSFAFVLLVLIELAERDHRP